MAELAHTGATTSAAAPDHLHRSKSGAVFANVSNAMWLIEHIRGLIGCFVYDEFAHAIMIDREINGGYLDEPRLLTEQDITATQCFLQKIKNGMPTVHKETVYQAIAAEAFKCEYHPVRDWLEEEKWDGTETLPYLLSDYFGAEDTAYHREIGRMFMISMVARIYEPGCKVDHMLVLEGQQGTLKSAACRVLAGGEKYFSDNLPPLDHKDSSIHLRGKWLIEISELHTFNRVADQAALKAFLTRQEEKYRPPHDRVEKVEPRSCVFIGTTNKHEYLKDETGGRRIWPVKTRKIDLDRLIEDRPQLFAEAVHRYKAKEPWWPSVEFERQHIRPQQELRYDEDPLQEQVMKWTSSHVEACAKDNKPAGFSLQNLLIHCFPGERLGRAEKNRVVAILERSGKWVRGPRAGKDGSTKWVKVEG